MTRLESAFRGCTDFKHLSASVCSLAVLVFEQFIITFSFEDSKVLKGRFYPLPCGDLTMLLFPGSHISTVISLFFHFWGVLASVPFEK